MDATRSEGKLPVRLLLVLSLLATVAPFSIDMYLPGLPQLAIDLDTEAAQVQLTLTTFMLGLSAGQLIIGPLSDRFGRRRPLVIGSVVCVLSALVCAVAPSIGVLVAARAVQGFAGAAGVVIGRAVVADLTTGRAAARTFSLLMTINGFAPIVAPLLGGAVIAFSGWRAVFFVLTAIAIAMAMGALFVVPETLPPERRHGGGLTVLQSSVGSVLRERRFVGYALVLAFSFGALFAYISASSFVLQNVVGLSTGWFSVVFAGNALGGGFISALNARAVRRIAPRRLLTVAISMQLLGTVALLLLFLTGRTSAAFVLPALFVSSASLGGMFGNATALAIELVRHRAGTGSAVIGVLQYGVAGLTSPLVGLGGERAALPMAITMVACSTLAALALLSTRLGQRTPRPGDPADGPAEGSVASASRPRTTT